MSRVLIIDDDPILLDTLASTLRFKLPDVHIETVDSALASLERIRSIEYEAIICDGYQPRIEGVALVRAVRKIHPERPALLLLKKHDQDLIWCLWFAVTFRGFHGLFGRRKAGLSTLR